MRFCPKMPHLKDIYVFYSWEQGRGSELSLRSSGGAAGSSGYCILLGSQVGATTTADCRLHGAISWHSLMRFCPKMPHLKDIYVFYSWEQGRGSELSLRSSGGAAGSSGYCILLGSQVGATTTADCRLHGAISWHSLMRFCPKMPQLKDRYVFYSWEQGRGSELSLRSSGGPAGSSGCLLGFRVGDYCRLQASWCNNISFQHSLLMRSSRPMSQFKYIYVFYMWEQGRGSEQGRSLGRAAVAAPSFVRAVRGSSAR